MRLFIAIQLPNELKEYLIDIQKQFKEYDLKFVKKDQMHLTLDFLGEMPESKIGTLVNGLSKIHSEKFMIRLASAGSFPSKEKIRVIWIGIESDDVFLKLQKDIRKVTGHKDKLMPHLTIGRAKKIIIDRKLSEKIKGLEISPKEFVADRFILFESIPTPSGHEHKIVQEFCF